MWAHNREPRLFEWITLCVGHTLYQYVRPAHTLRVGAIGRENHTHQRLVLNYIIIQS
jgi:hypothetical protein